MGFQANAMKGAVFLTVGLMIFAAAMAVTTETESYAEMAALEQDDVDHTPKVPADDEDEQGLKEVKEALIQEKEGHASEPSASETAFDSKADSVNPTSLFPGPVYGLPGYKESHDWLNDVDWWSPLVFDWRYYKARCGEGCNGGDPLKNMNEGEVKKYWVEKGMNNNDASSTTFNCNFYVQQNENLHEELMDSTGKVKCKEAVEHFLTDGLFDGLTGTAFDGETFHVGEKNYWQPRSEDAHSPSGMSGSCFKNCEAGQIKWDKNFAWTFWYIRQSENHHEKIRKVLPVFAVKENHRGWWGGFPFFVTWMGSMMFCASSRWDCQWPIGEENSGVKGGWRFNWYHRWRLPPVNWWRFYGVVANEDGYTLYEFSDPPIIGNDNMNKAKARHNLPYAVHGFSRQIATKTKGSWWGYDIHAPYQRKDGVWNANRGGSEQLPETCVKVGKCNCWEKGWVSNRACRMANTVEECGFCKEKDGVIVRDRGRDSFKCKCKKEWDKIKGAGMKKFKDSEAIIWTGYDYDPQQCPRCGWHWNPGKETPQYIMDLTYYRLGDHTFSEKEMEALYLKGRSTKVPGDP